MNERIRNLVPTTVILSLLLGLASCQIENTPVQSQLSPLPTPTAEREEIQIPEPDPHHMDGWPVPTDEGKHIDVFIIDSKPTAGPTTSP